MAILNGTITEGGTAQNFTDLSDDVFGFVFFAIGGDMTVNIGGTAADGAGIPVAAGQSCGFVRRRGETISVLGATTDWGFAVMEVV